MELKPLSMNIINVLLHRSNRTFMELKQEQARQGACVVDVLIVPLWN